ncbi:MAG: SpoIIE family protein phosphatase [Actinomycetes bacterium]
MTSDDTPGASVPGHPPLDEERFRLALEAGQMGTWRWDLVTDDLQWDAPLQRVFGLEPGTFSGTYEEYLQLLHPEDRERTSAAIAASLERREQHYVEHRVMHPDGSTHWISGTGRVVLDAAGEAVAFVGVGADITERKLAEARLRLLARAGEVLGSSLDLQTVFQQVAELAIESLADWCTVDLIDRDDVVLAAIAHRDPTKVAYARRLRERFPVDRAADSGLGAVLRTGQPDIAPVLEDAEVRAALDLVPGLSERDKLEFLALGLRASMVVPLLARSGEVLGAITLVSAESRRAYTDNDVDLAVELARRAAVAVENARLHGQVRHAALTLQRSLLPPAMPEVPFLEIESFYAPLATDELIGGDFYDVFPLSDGSWGLVIGDVAGKGVDAAALTAASRWTLRTSLTRTHAPQVALAQLNEALLQAGDSDRFVTVLAAVVRWTGTDAVLTYASGGHPAPLVRRLDGTVEQLEVDGQIVGVLRDAPATPFTVRLQQGDVLVAYSDGFTEARQGGRLFGEEGMIQALAATSGREAGGVVTALHDAVAHFGPQRDDMALLVARVQRPPVLETPGPTAAQSAASAPDASAPRTARRRHALR